jgi:hypothetical protein
VIEVVLKFKDGEEITVNLQDFIAKEWKDDKKINGNLRKCGAEIIMYNGVRMKDGKEIEPEKVGAEGEEFLTEVVLDDFDANVEVMPDGLRVLNVDAGSTQKLEDHLFATDPLLKDLEAIRDVVGYTEFDFKKDLS